MTMTQTEILESIDQIENVITESEVNVTLAIIDSYQKALTIMENYNGDDYSSFSIFQEGAILDEARGAKDENMIKRILLFIPRLIQALGKALMNVIKKSNTDTSKQEAVKDFFDNMDQYSDDTIQKAENDINEKIAETGKKVSFDKKKKTMSFKDINWKFHIKSVLSVVKAIKRLKDEFNLKDPENPIRQFVDECKSIKSGYKKPGLDTTAYGAIAFASLVQDFISASEALSYTSIEVSAAMENIIEHDENKGELASEKKQKVCASVKQVSNQIAMVQGEILNNIEVLNTVTSVIEKVHSTAKIVLNIAYPFNSINLLFSQVSNENKSIVEFLKNNSIQPNELLTDLDEKYLDDATNWIIENKKYPNETKNDYMRRYFRDGIERGSLLQFAKDIKGGISAKVDYFMKKAQEKRESR